MLWQLFKIELFKIFKRPRTFIAFGAIAIIVLLIQFALKINGKDFVELYLDSQEDVFDVPYDKLLHKTRKREIVQARQITMYLAKAFTKNSLKTIGEHFGGRDHTTVIHSCQTVKDLMDTDGVFRENVLELQQKVQLAAM